MGNHNHIGSHYKHHFIRPSYKTNLTLSIIFYNLLKLFIRIHAYWEYISPTISSIKLALLRSFKVFFRSYGFLEQNSGKARSLTYYIQRVRVWFRCVGAKLEKKVRPLFSSLEFPRGNSEAMNYTRCCM